VNEFIYDVSRIYVLTTTYDDVVTTSYDDVVTTTYDDIVRT